MPFSEESAAQSAKLQQAVLSALAYSEQFGFPLTIDELHRYLHGVQADRTTVENTADQLVQSAHVVSCGSYFARTGRQHFFKQRGRRQSVAESLWRRARHYTKVLASIPTVRMVGVTGSLAVSNTESGADIDLMLIVDGGTLWRTRAVVKLLQMLDKRLGGNVCVNYVLSERALELPDPSLYVARELFQMVPLYGLDTYHELCEKNLWAYSFFPNAGPFPEIKNPVHPVTLIRTPLRPLFKSHLANRLEAWECQRKLHRYNETDFLVGEYSKFSEEASGHRLHVRKAIEDAHQKTLSRNAPDRKPRVLVGQSYHLYFDPKLWREMKPYPPLGSLYAAAVLREAGFDVSFYDSMLSTEEANWKLALDRYQPDYVVLFEDNFNYLTKMCLLRMRKAAVSMIKAACATGTKVIVAGADASDHPDVYLEAGSAYVIRGEGEVALAQLLKAVRGAPDTAPEQIHNLSYYDAQGNLVQNPMMPVVRKLDALPLPAWDLVNLELYRNIWRHRHGRFSVNLVTTRGCPYHCNWCAKPIWGQRYNSRSPENVASEIALLHDRAQPDHIWFMDDIFGLKPGWVTQFADALETHGVQIRFKCLTRPDLLRREGEIDAMARAGCETIWLGAESGSQEILDAMEKGTLVADIASTTQRLRERGIRVGYFIQYGYPGESWMHVRATLAMIRNNLPDELGISVSYPLPGTPFYERVQAQLGRTRNWQDSDDLAMLFQGPFSTKFYRRLHSFTHRYLAWHRTLKQLTNGQFFSLPLKSQLYRASQFVLSMPLLPTAWLHLRLLAQYQKDALTKLPTALNRKAAANPSSQNPLETATTHDGDLEKDH